jgi:hypothetical protein
MTSQLAGASWSPVLASNDAATAEAWDAVHAIARAIEYQDYPVSQTRGMRVRSRTHEEALLFGYLALACDDDHWFPLVEDRLNAALGEVPARPSDFSLFRGVCGTGWTAQHLSRCFESTDEEGSSESQDDLAFIDIAATKLFARGPWRATYDLIGGLVGYGTYFLERLPAATAATGLVAILDRLEELAQPEEPGVTWFTPPALLPDWQRELFPNGYYNLGVAHGIPGILYLLAELTAFDIEGARARRLLDAAMRWFLAQRYPPEAGGGFGSWIPADGTAAASRGERLAWCYGDLGVLAVLTQVATRSGVSEWVTVSREQLDSCLARTASTEGILDAPLCHGAMGNAHIFSRLYQLTGDARCQEAARVYIRRALDMRRPGEGVAGFVQYTRPDRDGSPVLEPSAAFLDGAIGVALALLAAMTPVEPDWDRLMLLSGRPGSLSSATAVT